MAEGVEWVDIQPWDQPGKDELELHVERLGSAPHFLCIALDMSLVGSNPLGLLNCRQQANARFQNPSVSKRALAIWHKWT